MRFLFAFLAITLFFSCNSSKKETVKTHPFTNDLIHESSPYLLQHAHNPVNWKPYGEAALQQAKKEKKLMIISIGYAACHWCHVMEHESFEDSTVAAVMNKSFIAVKVDREERPDVDQTYINAVQLMTGSAGWPLNVVTLPDGRPVWGGTYFRKNDWINALEQIQETYNNEPEKLIAYANRLEEGIKSMDLVHLNTEDVDFARYPTAEIVKNLSQNFDLKNGGFKGAPKFPMPNNYEFLLRQAVEKNDTELLNFVTLTLDKMAYGGIYDQIGGGFARYSTDEKWHVPHFEKMLYDNAQLVNLYCNAYLVTQKPLYKEVVEETLESLNCKEKQQIKIFNKIDALTDKSKINYVNSLYPNCIMISAERGINISSLKNIFIDYYEQNFVSNKIRTDHTKGNLVAKVHSMVEDLKTTYDDFGITIEYKTSKHIHEQILRLFNGK